MISGVTIAGGTADALILRESAPLTSFNRCAFTAIARHSRAGFKVGRIFQAIAPGEAVLAHDPHNLIPFWRQAALVTAPRGDAADVHGQPRLVQRSAGPLGSVNPAPCAASAVIGAAVDGLLFGARTEGA